MGRPSLRGGWCVATGAKHKRITEISFDDAGTEQRRYYADCRCTIGEDHDHATVLISRFDNDEDEDDGDADGISASDAADIWRSRGMDEDYMFGYSEDELRRAANED